MYKKMVALYYAPLRPYVNRIIQKSRRFLWDWVPDLLLIFGSVAILMYIWELCFWN